MASETPARFEVRLLGAVELILDGQRLRAFDSLRLQRFVAMIALRREAQHRSRLAFELWPDSDEAQARTNLRKLLHELRRALTDFDELVEMNAETVRLLPTGRIEVDVWRFRDAIAVGDLELAARTYAGDLLPACYDDWVLDERAKLRTEAHRALLHLADEAARRGDHEATLRHAQRILELEPTDEAAVRMKMEAHVALGDRAAALRAYHRCVETLDRELAVTPGAAIESLYQELRASEEQGRDVAPMGESPFVGRATELRTLLEAWASARSGRAQLVLVTGEPGIGKSRLAMELGRRVRAEQHLVVPARAYEAAGRLPWGPVVDLLRSDALRSHIDALDPVWRAELARLLPELSVEPPHVTVGSGDVAQRHRLFDAVSRALVGERPRLLIIDDLQWCDTETIELIGFIVRACRTAPVLIAGTVRSEEVPEHHPLGPLTDALERDRALTLVPLARLDEATTAALATRLGAGETIDPALATRLWSETDGNPLFVIEVVRAGLSSASDRPVLTATMRAVLLARLNQLSAGARRVAAAAAVIGRPFSVGLMAAASRLGEDDVVDHIDELWRRRIIRDHGPRYDFSHDKIRTVALEMVSPSRRRQLHRAVAEAMVVELRDVAPAAAQLAAHYDQAGMIEQAIDAYRAAGARAVAVSAFDEAVSMFQRALALLADVPPSPDRDALDLEIRVALGSPLVAVDGYGSKSAHQLYERALALCRRLGRPVDAPILRGLGLARLQGCRFDESGKLGQALVDHESRDPVAQTEGRYLLGVSAFWRGELASARDHLVRAVQGYDVSRRAEHLASYAQDPKAVCLVRLAWVELWAGDPGLADETARSAIQLAVELDHLMTLGYVLTYAAIVAAESEDFARLAELLEELERLSKRYSMRYLGIVGEALRAWQESRAGSVRAVEAIVQAVERSRAEGETLHLSYCLLLLARARAAAGELAQGLAATREGIAWSRSPGCGQRYLEVELLRADGELAYRNGDPSAKESLERAVDLARAQGARWLELGALQSLAARFPEAKAREQLGELVRTLPSGHGLPPFRAAVDFLSESAR